MRYQTGQQLATCQSIFSISQFVLGWCGGGKSRVQDSSSGPRMLFGVRLRTILGWKVAVILAFFMVYLIISAPLVQIVPPVEIPNRTMIINTDVTLTELADKQDTVVFYQGSSGRVFNLRGYIVITETGRLTISDEALLVGLENGPGDFSITVDGELVIERSAVRANVETNSTWAGISIGPVAKFSINGSSLAGAENLVRIKDQNGTMNHRIAMNMSAFKPQGNALSFESIHSTDSSLAEIEPLVLQNLWFEQGNQPALMLSNVNIDAHDLFFELVDESDTGAIYAEDSILNLSRFIFQNQSAAALVVQQSQLALNESRFSNLTGPALEAADSSVSISSLELSNISTSSESAITARGGQLTLNDARLTNISSLFDLDRVDGIISAVELENVGSWGRMKQSGVSTPFILRNLTHNDNFVHGTSLLNLNDSNVKMEGLNVSLGSNATIIETRGGELILQLSELSSNGTLLSASGDAEVYLNSSLIQSSAQHPVLTAADESRISLFGTALTGGSALVRDDGVISKQVRPAFQLSHLDSNSNSTAEVAIFDAWGVEVAGFSTALQQYPDSEIQLARFAGVYEPQWNQSGVLLDLWSIEADGQVDWVSSPVRYEPMFRVEWSALDENGKIWMPLQDSRIHHLDLGGDSDLDGWKDTHEDQQGAKAVMAADVRMNHDLQAVDMLSFGWTDSANLTLQPVVQSGEHQLWVRWKGVSANQISCVQVELAELNNRNAVSSAGCIVLPSTMRWIPGPLIQATREGAAVILSIESGSETEIILDEAWLVPVGEQPKSAWLADIDRDELLDGLENPILDEIHIVAPHTLGWGDISNPVLTDATAPWGWSIVQNQSDIFVAPPPSYRSEIWIHATPAASSGYRLELNASTIQDLLLEQASGWQPLRDRTGASIILAADTSLRLISNASGNRIQALWYRQPWDVNQTWDLTAGTHNIELNLTGMDSTSRLHLTTPSVERRSADAAEQELLAVDEVTGLVVAVGLNCNMSSYFKWGDPSTRGPELTLLCAAQQEPVTVAVEAGWLATLLTDAAGRLELLIQPIAEKQTAPTLRQELIQLNHSDSQNISLDWEGGRLLVQAGQNNWWIVTVNNSGVWESFRLGQQNGSTDPLSLFLDDLGSRPRGEMELCLANDLIFMLVGFGGWWTLASGNLAEAESFSPLNATKLIIQSGQVTSQLSRHSILRQWDVLVENSPVRIISPAKPQLVCTPGALIVHEDSGGDTVDRLWVKDLRTGATMLRSRPNYDLMQAGVGSTLIGHNLNGEWHQWDIWDSSGQLSIHGEGRLIGNSSRMGLAALVSPHQLFLPGVEPRLYAGEEGRPYARTLHYAIWWAEASLTVLDSRITQPEDMRSLRAIVIDHEIFLPALLAARTRSIGNLRIRIGAEQPINISITTTNVSTLPLLSDSDSDGLVDGTELYSPLTFQYGHLSDATGHLHCVQPRSQNSLAERWDADPQIRLDDQCHLAEGIQMLWRPEEGPGSSLSWPLYSNREGLHRLSLSSSSFVIPNSGVQPVMQGIESGQVPPTRISTPGQPLPQWVESAQTEWLPQLLDVRIIDGYGADLPIAEDAIWIEDLRLETTARGQWTVRARLGGWIDVQVESVSTVQLQISFEPDGFASPFNQDSFGPAGPRDLSEIEYIHLAPLNSFSWGPLGGTDPLSADTDEDGLNDSVDLVPLQVDVDEDGLSDGQEWILGTSSMNRDTDGDGLLDGVEVSLSLSVNSTTCLQSAQIWRDAIPSVRDTLGGVVACSADNLEGAASWLHRRLATELINLDPISHIDANSSSWTEPLQRDTDADGLPDGWIDGWEYRGKMADGNAALPDDASGAANLIALTTLGAYDESRWLAGPRRDGLLSLLEGEDWNLDGDSSSAGLNLQATWGMLAHWYLPRWPQIPELDPRLADSDGDRLPDGWELLTSAWFTDNGFPSTHQDPTRADGDVDYDVLNGEFVNLDSTANYDNTTLWLNASTDLIWGMRLTAASEVPGNCSSDKILFNSFQFHAIGLPEGTQVALSDPRIYLDDQLDGNWDQLTLQADLWGDVVGGLVRFGRPLEVAPGVWESSLTIPQNACKLEKMLLLFRFPQVVNSSYTPIDLITLKNTSHPQGLASRSSDTGSNWTFSEVDWAAVVTMTLVGRSAGDGLSALAEYWIGTLPTNVDSDAASGPGKSDLLNDRIEVVPAIDPQGGIVAISSIPVRWVTTGHRARLSWNKFTSTASSSLIGIDPEVGMGRGSQGTHIWFTFDISGNILHQQMQSTACSDPSAMVPFARLDDGSWMALDVPLTGTEGETKELCLFHRSVHANDDTSWNNALARAYRFILTESELPTGVFAGTWTIDNLPRHQFGFVGAPFQRDGDGDGLMDGLEGIAAWSDSSTSDGDFTRWANLSGVGDQMLSESAWDSDHDGDGTPDIWDIDADDDGLMDGLEPGWMVDLDGDGLPGSVDPDSDSDGVLDGDESQPFRDSDGDGTSLLVHVTGGGTATVKLGVDALDFDSDDDGLPDGMLDGIHWSVMEAGLVDASASNWIFTAGGTAAYSSFSKPGSATKWFPTSPYWNLSGKSPLRLVGGPVLPPLGGGLSGAANGWGAWVHSPLFDESVDVMQPWEGENRDSEPGFQSGGVDTDPTRRDTDLDGLLDGVALFVGWDLDLSSTVAPSWSWSHRAASRPLDLVGIGPGAILEPDLPHAPLLGAWGRAGELVGPTAPQAWIPPTPWQQSNSVDSHSFGSRCTDPSYQNWSRTADPAGRAAWQSSLFRDSNSTLLPQDHVTACWDLIQNEMNGSWNWSGWSDALNPDSDADGLPDAEERRLIRIQPTIPAWSEWWQDISAPIHASRAYYFSASDPRLSDTDGDGLNDGLEFNAGYATDDPDTDHDGLADDVEDADGDGRWSPFETSPRDIDSDRDGLPDAARTLWDATRIDLNETYRKLLLNRSYLDGSMFAIDPGEANQDGTARSGDPTVADSDHDGLLDGTEWLIWQVCEPDCALSLTDLLWSMDADSDGLHDSAEVPPWARPMFGRDVHSNLTADDAWWVALSLDPTKNDTDADGLSDGWEPYGLSDSNGNGTINGRDPHSSGGSSTDAELSSPLAWRTAVDGIWNVRDLSVDSTSVTFTRPITPFGSANSVHVATESTVLSLPVLTRAVELAPFELVEDGANHYFGGIEAEILGVDGQLRTVRAQVNESSLVVLALYLPRSSSEWTRLKFTGSEVDSLLPQITSELTLLDALLDTRAVVLEDLDMDGANNSVELTWNLDDQDRDSDDDGIRDGLEITLCRALRHSADIPAALLLDGLSYDVDGDGLLCGNDVDSDGDGLRDGVEIGLSHPVGPVVGLPGGDLPGTNVNATLDATSNLLKYRPDADPATRTDPLDPDTDGDGVPDGWLDLNHDLVADAEELDRPHQRLTQVVARTGIVSLWTTDGQVDWLDIANGAGRRMLRGAEDADADGSIGDLELDPLDVDADDDGLPDGPSTRFRRNLHLSWLEESVTASTLAAILADPSASVELHRRCAGEGWNATSWSAENEIAAGTPLWRTDRDNDSVLNHFDNDTDNDGLVDGLECGVTDALLRSLGWWQNGNATQISFATDSGMVLVGHATDVSKLSFYPDPEPASVSDPWDYDSDDDGLSDGREDANRDGVQNRSETDPMHPDSDRDGLMDGTESGMISSRIWVWATDTALHVPRWAGGADPIYTFISDADAGLFSTNPLSNDTDGDGLLDSEEDINRNGAYDPWNISAINSSAGLAGLDSLAANGANQQLSIEGDWYCEWWLNFEERQWLYPQGTTPAMNAPWTYQSGCELDADNPDTDLDGALDGIELEGWRVDIHTVRFTDSGSIDAAALGPLWATRWTDSSPWVNDSDADGVNDGDELRWRADPRREDTDGDHLDDGWEAANNGSLTVRDGQPPRIDADKSSLSFDISIHRDGRQIYLVRAFSARLRISDPAGVASSNIWMAPDGSSNTHSKLNVHQSVTDAVGLSPYISGAIAASIRDSVHRSRDSQIQIERGLVTNLIWDGRLTSRVEIDVESGADAAGSIVRGVGDYVAGAVGIDVDEASRSDLLDQFGGWNLYITASDSNGNLGRGSIEFESLAETIVDAVTVVWESLVELFDRFRAWAADVLEAALEWIKEKAMWLVDEIIKPLIEMYLSAAALLYPWIEYVVVIIEIFAYGDVMAFWNHPFTQAAFGSVLSLLREWNLLTFTESPDGIIGWIGSSLTSFTDTLISQLPDSLDEFAKMAIGILPLAANLLEGISTAIFELMGPEVPTSAIALMLMMMFVAIRAGMALPKALPLPTALLTAILFGIITLLVASVLETIVGSLIEKVDEVYPAGGIGGRAEKGYTLDNLGASLALVIGPGSFGLALGWLIGSGPAAFNAELLGTLIALFAFGTFGMTWIRNTIENHEVEPNSGPETEGIMAFLDWILKLTGERLILTFHVAHLLQHGGKSADKALLTLALTVWVISIYAAVVGDSLLVYAITALAVFVTGIYVGQYITNEDKAPYDHWITGALIIFTLMAAYFAGAHI
uniref:OmpA domain-containing protein n=1 Tax=uncultured marine group II/III euryarchaeote KM3_80_G12 TaxID=1456515 RepID=A0A075HRE8_9EURY|nr:OmpA domain-containing protein [uncultured marine group II/III euryarchaeote KM3_80_G12]